jgi:hypothetical protein
LTSLFVDVPAEQCGFISLFESATNIFHIGKAAVFPDLLHRHLAFFQQMIRLLQPEFLTIVKRAAPHLPAKERLQMSNTQMRILCQLLNR